MSDKSISIPPVEWYTGVLVKKRLLLLNTAGPTG